jgi:hypothetical protein
MSISLTIYTFLLESFLMLAGALFAPAVSEDLPGNEKLHVGNTNLFYIKRNTDDNLVVYDANLLPNKSFDPEKPVKVYWIRNTEGGIKKDLSYIQKKMAYGLDLKKIANNYEGTIAAYEKRVIKISQHNGKPMALVIINGKWQQLNYIYLNIKDPKAIIPKITFIQLFGKDLQSGIEVSEKIPI